MESPRGFPLRLHEIVAVLLLTQVPLLYAKSSTVAGTVLLLVGLYLLVPDQLLKLRNAWVQSGSYRAWLYREVVRLEETQLAGGSELQADPIAGIPAPGEFSGLIEDLSELAFLSVVGRIVGTSVLSLVAPLGEEATAFASVDGQTYQPVRPIGRLLVHWAEDERFVRLDVARMTRDSLRFAFVPAPAQVPRRVAAELPPRIDSAQPTSAEV